MTVRSVVIWKKYDRECKVYGAKCLIVYMIPIMATENK